jgi:hypothetical protein
MRRQTLHIAARVNETKLESYNGLDVYMFGYTIVFHEYADFDPHTRLANGTWIGALTEVFE